jgi:hypothetical protein
MRYTVGVPPFDRRYLLCAVLAYLAIALTIATAKVRHVGSDPRGALLLTQVILQERTVKLDSIPNVRQKYGYVIHRQNGHYYYNFPLGTSVAAIPFVAPALAFGADMQRHEKPTQLVIVACVSMLSFKLLTDLARLYVRRGLALALAVALWFGSAFASTGATALWSHDFATLFALLAILSALRSTSLPPARASWCGLTIGACLFLAYCCRPTMAALVPCVLAFSLLHGMRVPLQALAVLAAGMGLFVAFSFWEFGQPVPDYYLPKRLSGDTFATALAGNLFSPSRGLFVFSPIFSLPLLLLRSTIRALRQQRGVLLVAVVWPVLHLLVISQFPHWWGGYVFGPRLLMDVLPGLFLLLCLTMRQAGEDGVSTARSALYITGAVSIFINTYQGLFNTYTAKWNAEPSIDKHSELVFDWTYPQFLHTRARHLERLRSYP